MRLLDLKPGDRVKIDDEGVERNGIVSRISIEEQEVCIHNGIQEFWYQLNQVKGVPLSEEQLFSLGFEKKETEKGAKYGKEAFRVLAPAVDDFSSVEVWYRDDHRHFNHPLMVHELQNLHLDMTKMTLEA